VFERILRDSVPILDATGGAKVVLVVPFPRYVTGKCCKDEMHITNYGTKGFWSELDRPDLSVKTEISALEYDKELSIFKLSDVIGDTVLSDMAGEHGHGAGSIWAEGDPVHLNAEVYASIGRALADSDSEEPRNLKRARIESVVARAGPPSKRAKAPVRLPDRLSGKQGTVQSRGRGRGRGPGSYQGWLAPGFGGRRPRRF
jgi:hypothetical protein